ncbi:MAG: hypothetical protein HOM25_06420 [Rhodospirillaceae bacterium]|jgi:F0F1-type ATP synthase membrane subunit b/b'|nr:hypothetical protein [Rhodospirillaceae bacterium]MBT5667034.1 hypothetical protein [Rhodospirillaceae bacterium]MBT5810170.1 hypothetical protein [Rhodospirillaceae bacterium]
MMKTILGGAVAALLLTGAMTAPAWAGCAEDIKNVEKQVSEADTKAEGAVKYVEKMIAKAKKALADGNTKKCANLIGKAQDKVDTQF